MKLLCTVLGLILAVMLGVTVYVQYLLGQINYVDPENTTLLSQLELDKILGSSSQDSGDISFDSHNTQIGGRGSPIVNILLIGQDRREGESRARSDSMILCTFNKQTKQLIMTSFLRDLYVPLPAYAGHSGGRNRINVCYALGSTWKRSSEGGMEMLAKCIEQNFGVHIDHTIEVSFDTFAEIINAMDGVDIILTEEEAQYLTDHVGYVGSFQAGENALMGYDALAYARIRKIDGDRQRAARQRAVVTSLIEKCRNMGLLELHDLATQILPLIITDMTSEEITDYLWELIPMVKDIKLASLTIPVDNETLPHSMWSKNIELYGYQSTVLECNLKLNAEYLQNALGME